MSGYRRQGTKWIEAGIGLDGLHSEMDLGGMSLAHQSRGWREENGWWSPTLGNQTGRYGLGREPVDLRFGASTDEDTEKKLLTHLDTNNISIEFGDSTDEDTQKKLLTRLDTINDSIESRLQDLLPFVKGLRLGFGETGFMMKKVLEALSSSKPSQLEMLEARGSSVNFELGIVSRLGRAIESGHLKNLVFLDLGGTHIGDDHMKTLADAFQKGEASVLPKLKELILSDNFFTEVGMLSLAMALSSGRLDSLKKLDLARSSNNTPSEKSANAFISALQGNNSLTVDIKFEWFMFPDLDRVRRQLMQRNSRNVAILAGLSEFPELPARFGKVYLCGNPVVGKTTLRHTLQRSFWESIWTWETKPHLEKRTRGIEVSHFLIKSRQLGNNPITLRVWDMAGQEDYHLVHNAFFPALTFAEGRATSFIVVCRTSNLERSVQELDYWLRYIASSCDKTIPNLRHVLVVFNNFGGRQTARRYDRDWKEVLEVRREKFHGYLDIQTDLFLVDVRKHRHVKGLRKHLSQFSTNLLKVQKVPAICQLIQENLFQWVGAKLQCPVLQWEEFVKEINKIVRPRPTENVIEAAAKYLDEAGILIYIDKAFPAEWQIPYRRLVVLDPNWVCNEIVGHMFLSEDMLIEKEHLFRLEVDRTTGSISIPRFRRFFRSLQMKWNNSDFDDVINILLWLGLCYKGRDSKMFIPALISEHGTPGRHWSPQNLCAHEGNQWVMGFSVEHERNEIALAPISLWHRFQVEIAQTPTFNGKIDNDLVSDKYFMTFNVDFMTVLIVCQNSLFKLSKNDLYNPRRSGKKQTESSTRAQQKPVPAASSTELKWGSPTFDEINIFVMPLKKKDDMDGTQRKQLQVDLASDLVEILLGLWNAVCPGVNYVHRVIWPWPVSKPGPEIEPKKNAKVTEVQKWVQEHEPGRKMQWEVGSDNWITEDQLLSKKDKSYVVDSVEETSNVVRQGMREAVELQIFPPDVLPEEASSEYRMGSTSQSDEIKAASQPLSPTGKLVLELDKKVSRVEIKVDSVDKKVDKVHKKVEEGFKMVMKQHKELLHKLQDTEEIFLQDKDRTCPNHIYLGKKTTEGAWAWATLKEAVSRAVSVTVRVHFACEAEFDRYRPHPVKNQQGLDLSELKDWVKTITPWLKVSLTVLYVSTKVAANFVLPGVGLVVPGFGEWTQGKALSEGISWATGYSIEELDKLMIEGMGLDANPAHWDPRELYGKSREAMTKLIGRLTPEKYEKKLGLGRVLLKSGDGSSHGIVWICSECFEKFRNYDSSTVREMPLDR